MSFISFFLFPGLCFGTLSFTLRCGIRVFPKIKLFCIILYKYMCSYLYEIVKDFASQDFQFESLRISSVTILFLFLTSQLSISDYKCLWYLIIHFLPFSNCNFQLLIVDHKYLQYWIIIFSRWIVEIHKLILGFISLSDADRWSRKLRRWQTSSSHNLLANGEWWSPVEDSENLHVPRSSKTGTLLDVR